MKLADYKRIFVTAGLIGILLISSPALVDVIRFPGGEQFSGLYLLGPDQTATNLPSNIAVGQNYTVYLGVGNQLGSSTYYVFYVKLGNETDPLPNETTQTPSSLAPLYEYQVFVQNGMNWTAPLTFSISDLSIFNNQSSLGSITINNMTFDVDKTALLDQKNTGYYYQILVELWAFNPTLGTLQYQNRYVYFWLNMTSAA